MATQLGQRCRKWRTALGIPAGAVDLNKPPSALHVDEIHRVRCQYSEIHLEPFATLTDFKAVRHCPGSRAMVTQMGDDCSLSIVHRLANGDDRRHQTASSMVDSTSARASSSFSSASSRIL